MVCILIFVSVCVKMNYRRIGPTNIGFYPTTWWAHLRMQRRAPQSTIWIRYKKRGEYGGGNIRVAHTVIDSIC